MKASLGVPMPGLAEARLSRQAIAATWVAPLPDQNWRRTYILQPQLSQVLHFIYRTAW
jgi:hypothetical protein